jgi:colanic acid biosynthesis glycosyl transferase WcaI
LSTAAAGVDRLAQILLVEQFFYPEGWGGAELPRDVAQHLQRNGHQVTVLCGTDQYVPVTGDPGANPVSDGIQILRVPKLPGNDIHRHKALRQLLFYAYAIRYLFFRRPPELYIAQTNPPMIVVLIALAARFWRRPFMVIAQDLYPEALIAHGMLGESSLAVRLLTMAFSWSYRRAGRVVSLGPGMNLRLIAKGVPPDRIVLISNWATGAQGVVTGAANRLGGEWGLQSRCVIMYSGNLGIGHEFQTLLDGLALAVQSHPDLMLLIIGRGSRLDEVRAGVAERQLERNVMFRELVPAERLPESFGLATLAVVTLRQGFEGLIVPSKVPGYMSRGVPVLYIGPRGDTSDLIGRAHCGRHLLTGDAAGVAAELAKAATDPEFMRTAGEQGWRYYQEHLSKKMALERYLEVVNSCLADRLDT